MPSDPSQAGPLLAGALSGVADASDAAEQCCDQAHRAMARAAQGGARSTRPELVLAFYSGHHAERAVEISSIIRRRLDPGCLIGVAAESVLGGALELEGSPGLSLLIASLPGVTVHPFTTESFPALEAEDQIVDEQVGKVIGADGSLRAVLFFPDPFSVPLVRLLPAMNRALKGVMPPENPNEPPPRPPILAGGRASAAKAAGGNTLILNERVMRSGGVGVSLKGALRVDAVVSQGCMPFGPNFVVTKARHNVIFELGGKPAVEAIQEAIEDQIRPKLSTGGLFIGRVVDEYKERFGRGDYLIRNVIGVDPERGAIGVEDQVRVGQTIRMHVRDAETARKDLSMLLDAQRLHAPPAGAMLVTCSGRGERLLKERHQDAQAVARLFQQSSRGPERPVGGRAIEPSDPSLPIAGFFAGGEIGPVGSESHLHSNSACVVLFRAV